MDHTPNNRWTLNNLFDLNELPADDIHNDNIAGEIFDMGEGEEENFYEPFHGQCFLSEEEAYIFYANFAKRNGFSIRRGRFTTNKYGKVNRRDFFCHREGFPDPKVFDPSKDQRNTSSSRCGCKAHMRIALRKSFDIFPEEWHVTKFVSNHNHDLLLPKQVCLLRAYRSISKEDEKQILLYKEAGLKVRQIMRVMELEKNLKHGDLSFLRKDIYNFFTKLRQENMEYDAMNLLEHCKKAKNEDSRFQYAYTVDKENKLEHIFWSPAHCFQWYQDYGDAVAFDTTYKTFVSLMKKPPKSIITDQDGCMKEAIEIEIPLTKHAFCIWHITSKFSGWFTSILRDQYFKWCSEFYRLYKLDNIEDFEREWPLIVSKYHLQENKHVKGLYEVKHFWVPSYLRGHFFGGMTTTGRSESINSFVGVAIEDLEQIQLHNTMLDSYRGSCLRTLSPLEEQVFQVFTNFAFKKFQNEFAMATQYKVDKENDVSFLVQYFKELHSQKHRVTMSGDVVDCSCHHFEFWGILCRHILCVFLHQDCFQIPTRYLPLRWCRDELHGDQCTSMVTERTLTMEGSSNIEVGVDENVFVHCPPISNTKGRPKNTRNRSGKELTK